MKKLLSVLVVLATVFALCACGAKEVTGTAESAKSAEGDYTTATVTMKDGKFTSVTVDTYQAAKDAWKKALGNDYNMKTYGNSIGEWFEEAEAFEKWCVGKTLDEVLNVKTEVNHEGNPVPADGDLSTGCTIYIGQFQEAVKAAAEAAK